MTGSTKRTAPSESTDVEQKPAPSTPTEDDYSEDELRVLGQRFVDKWQPRLRLQHFDLKVRIGETSNPNYGAESAIAWRFVRATITLPRNCVSRSRAAEDYLADVPRERILEETIVHELLHVFETPEVDHVRDEINWTVGEDSITGAPLRNGFRDYREFVINGLVRILLDLDARGWPA